MPIFPLGPNLLTESSVTAISETAEGFAPVANLIQSRVPSFEHGKMIPGKGQAMDTWEPERHAPDAVARIALRAPIRVTLLDLDTHTHQGNECIRATVLGARSLDPAAALHVLAEGVPLGPNARHLVPVDPPAEVLRLEVHNENGGGLARLRLYADPHSEAELRSFALANPSGARWDGRALVLPHPPLEKKHRAAPPPPSPAQIRAARRALALGGEVNLISAQLGAQVVATSNSGFAPPTQLLDESPARDMTDGWETARSNARPESSDRFEFVRIETQIRGVPERVRFDFTHNPLNRPYAVELLGFAPDGRETVLLPRTPSKSAGGSVLECPIDDPSKTAYSRFEYRMYPDGATCRLAVIGRLTEVPPGATAD